MTFTVHSECPVTDISLLHSISMAVEKKTRNGDVLSDVQKLTSAEFYRKMTHDAAKLNGTEDKDGSVKISKYAYFVVLNKNPFDDKTTLSDNLVQMTVVNVRIIYEK